MDVGRSWYVKITSGMAGSTAELGTHHVAFGTQVWERLTWRPLEENLTEHQLVDELYAALLAILEVRTSIG